MLAEWMMLALDGHFRTIQVEASFQKTIHV